MFSASQKTERMPAKVMKRESSAPLREAPKGMELSAILTEQELLGNSPPLL
jgi:hypothetical protein